MMISVVIPAYNEESYIGDCIRSVLGNTPKNLLEIVVVNNASTDGTAAVASGFKKVRVVNEPQKGLTRARQRGLLEAKGEVLAYLDADTKVSAGWFEILNREFNADSSLVCLSGPYVFEGFSKSKSLAINFWYHIAQFFSLFTGYLVQGGNFAAKRQALLDMGGFDISIEFYGEETDVARRLHKFGKVKFLQEFKLLTSARRMNDHGLLKMAFLYGINFFSELFFKKPATKKYSDIR